MRFSTINIRYAIHTHTSPLSVHNHHNIMYILTRVLFGNRHILARSDGFVKCYTKGWVNAGGYVNAPFDDNGTVSKNVNGKTVMYKYDLKIIVSRAFLPDISSDLDGWKASRYMHKMSHVHIG